MKLNVLQLTDCHLFANPGQQLRGINTEQSFLSVLRTIFASTTLPNLILLTGDLTHSGEADAYHRLLTHCRQFTCPVYAIPGNHDQIAVMRQTYNDSKISMKPSFVQGDWHFILLNSVMPGHNEGALSLAELKFLQTALARYPQRPTLIALHHHVKPVRGHMDKIMLINTEAFSKIIAPYKRVRAVLCGHVHQAFDQTFNAVRYLASPSTCYQISVGVAEFAKDETVTPGYRWLALHDDGTIETTVLRV